jgi:hypothetical protein
MKQVWQATDGTIFEKEIDCEKYESRLSYREALVKATVNETDLEISEIFVSNLEFFVEQGMASILIDFINAIGD